MYNAQGHKQSPKKQRYTISIEAAISIWSNIEKCYSGHVPTF